jgi:hypothetical protein
LGVCPKENAVEDTVFWDMTTYGLEEVYQRFGGGCQYLADYTVPLFRRPMFVAHHLEEPHRVGLFLNLPLLPVALYRVVIQSEQHGISLPDVILHTYGAGDSTDMVYTTRAGGQEVANDIGHIKLRRSWPAVTKYFFRFNVHSFIVHSFIHSFIRSAVRLTIGP